MTLIITAQDIAEYGACSGQYDLFRHLFPNDCEVTRENFDKIRETNLDIYWAQRLLPDDLQREFVAVWDEITRRYLPLFEPLYKASDLRSQKYFEDAMALRRLPRPFDKKALEEFKALDKAYDLEYGQIKAQLQEVRELQRDEKVELVWTYFKKWSDRG